MGTKLCEYTQKVKIFSFFSKKIWSIQKKAVILHPLSSEEQFMPLPAEASFPDKRGHFRGAIV